MYATWFDAPADRAFDAQERAGGLVTASDTEPYHYSFDVLAGLCAALGLEATRLEGTAHPRGESVMVITRRAPQGGPGRDA
jgi:hypothetical protein